jgi:hypothetical protein
MPRRDLRPMTDRHQGCGGSEITPLQLSAWRRLWGILLTPIESQSASAVDEGTVKPEGATPLRTHPKRLGADELIRPRTQQRRGSHPEPSDDPR